MNRICITTPIARTGTEPGQRYDAKQPTVDEQLNSYRQQQEQQTQNSQPVYQSQPQGGRCPTRTARTVWV